MIKNINSFLNWKLWCEICLCKEVTFNKCYFKKSLVFYLLNYMWNNESEFERTIKSYLPSNSDNVLIWLFYKLDVWGSFTSWFISFICFFFPQIFWHPKPTGFPLHFYTQCFFLYFLSFLTSKVNLAALVSTCGWLIYINKH